MKRNITHTLIAIAAAFTFAACTDYLEPGDSVTPSSEPVFTLVNNSDYVIAWCIPQSAGALRDTIPYASAGTIVQKDSTQIIASELANYWAKDTLKLCIFNYQIMEAEAADSMGDDEVRSIIFKLSHPSFMQMIQITPPDLVKKGRRIVVD